MGIVPAEFIEPSAAERFLGTGDGSAGTWRRP
jgi:hypothetical protein